MEAVAKKLVDNWVEITEKQQELITKSGMSQPEFEVLINAIANLEHHVIASFVAQYSLKVVFGIAKNELAQYEGSFTPKYKNGLKAIFDSLKPQRKTTATVENTTAKALLPAQEPDVDECKSDSAIATVEPPTQPHATGTYTRKTTGWVGLHVHSHFSLLDGFRSPAELIDRVVELDQPGIALTDHGGMWGTIELMQAAKAKGKVAIPGNEMYLKDVEASERLKAYSGNGDYRVKSRYHQLVLAVSRKGYENLTKLTSNSYLHNSEVVRKKVFPLVTKEELAANKEGLVLTSGCLAGLVCQGILSGDLDFAKSTAQWFKDNFGANYYIEIQDHGLEDDQTKVNHHLVAIAAELGIGLVVTADSHYVRPEQKEAHKAFLRINKGEKFSNVYEGKFWHPSAQELKARLSYLPAWAVEQALDNTVLIAQQVESYSLNRKPVSPNFFNDELNEIWVGDTKGYLKHLAFEGLKQRGLYNKEYCERLLYELKVINQKGLNNYFLIVWDYVAFARSKEIPTGLGRGSAAGSLVAYSLKITGVDPIANGLVFSRFINEERESYPDIDLDFCIERRHEVVEYIRQKYGWDNVANIITFNKLESKSALKDSGWVIGVSHKTSDYYSKMLPVVRGKNVSLSACIQDSTYAPEFFNAYVNDLEVDGISFKKWVNLAIDLEKTIKSSGVHAAGVVIGDIPLTSLVPLQKNADGTICTQYNMKELEKLGLQKFDILGLKNLTTLDKAQRFIGKTYYDLENIDFSDKRVFETLHSGETEGIFQFESGIAPHIIKGIAPDNLNDISAANTLNRPGCLDLEIEGVRGLHEEYIARKFGIKPVKYSHPDLEPILKETYGLALYQEHALRFCSDIAGWSLAKADVCRAAIGKKNLELMASLEPEFKSDIINRGYPVELAEELWSILDASKNYSFNKAHSYAYGVIAYMCAYVKHYYPAQFFAALMSGQTDLTKIAKYASLLKRYNLKLLSPDINLSEADFTPTKDGILYGLALIQGLGEGALVKILTARAEAKFKSLTDFLQRAKVSTAIAETLIKAGAFDSLHPNRASAYNSIAPISTWINGRAKFVKEEQTKVLIPGINWNTCFTQPAMQQCNDFGLKQRLVFEKEVLGLSLSGHPLDEFLLEAEYLGNLQDGQDLDGVVLVKSSRPSLTKKSQPMGFATVEDSEGNELDLSLFGANWQCFGYLFQPGETVNIIGRVQIYNGKFSMIVKGAYKATLERIES